MKTDLTRVDDLPKLKLTSRVNHKKDVMYETKIEFIKKQTIKA